MIKIIQRHNILHKSKHRVVKPLRVRRREGGKLRAIVEGEKICCKMRNEKVMQPRGGGSRTEEQEVLFS